MKRRSSSTLPLFEMLEIDAADVGSHAGYIDDILAKRATGIILHNALSPDALRVAHERITRAEVSFFKSAFNEFPDSPASPFMLGRVLVSDTTELREYFDTARQTRAHLRELFAGVVDIEERIAELLGPLAGHRPVRVPEGPGGATYAPATIRCLPEGQNIGVHADNSSSRMPQMRELGTRVQIEHQLSFFFVLQAPQSGGDLVVYGLEWDDVAHQFPAQFAPDEILYDKTNSLLPLVELSGSERFTPRQGDLIVFDAGRHFHRVTPINGDRPRMTMGGFMALSRDATVLHYWS